MFDSRIGEKFAKKPMSNMEAVSPGLNLVQSSKVYTQPSLKTVAKP